MAVLRGGIGGGGIGVGKTITDIENSGDGNRTPVLRGGIGGGGIGDGKTFTNIKLPYGIDKTWEKTPPPPPVCVKGATSARCILPAEPKNTK